MLIARPLSLWDNVSYVDEHRNVVKEGVENIVKDFGNVFLKTEYIRLCPKIALVI